MSAGDFLASRAREAKRSGRGRPSHEPTARDRQTVEMLCALNINHEHIAEIIGVSDETLRKHYRKEIDIGKSKVIARVGSALVAKAVSDRPDAVNAAKFFLQSQGGWKERSEVMTTVRINPKDMTDEHLAAIASGSGEGVAAAPSHPGVSV